jgi:hypothetical protein
MECILYKDYKTSDDFKNEMQKAFGEVEQVAFYGVELSDTESPFFYYVTYKDRNNSNIGNSDLRFFQSFKTVYSLKNGSWRAGLKETGSIISTYSNKKVTAYLAFKNDFLNDKQQEWNRNRNTLMHYITATGLLIILGFLLLSFLILVTGKNPEDKETHLQKADKLYSDINFGIVVFLIFYIMIPACRIYDDIFTHTLI